MDEIQPVTIYLWFELDLDGKHVYQKSCQQTLNALLLQLSKAFFFPFNFLQITFTITM